MKFRKLSIFFALLAFATSSAGMLHAEAAKQDTPKEKELSLDQRVADLEAYINNAARVKDDAAVKPADKSPKSKVEGAGPGHNGFMMVCAALVLFMTLPGLALFYGGLVRAKNILSVMAQCLGIAGLVSIMWWAFGYSWAFAFNSYDASGAGVAGATFLGSLKFMFLKGVDAAPNTDYAAWISQNVFSMYQLMFAIITPALIIGAIAERMKFAAVLVFVALWMLVVYFPLAHMIWGIDGYMNGVWNSAAKIKAIDFAGGTVVHMSSGWSALVLCLILGKRIGYPMKNMSPHALVMTMIGTGMLWVGWYGFNAGSALAADGVAANAFMTTTLAAAIAGFVWALLEWILKGHPSVLGFCSGIVAGLVVITPAAGFVTASSSVIIGVLAGVIPFFAVVKMKAWLGYDDALDTFGVHAVGGTLGALVTGFFADPAVNANLNTNLKDIVGKTLYMEQLKAMGLTITLSVVATAVIAYLIKFTIGLRSSAESESIGLDISEHGEEGYNGLQTFIE